MSAPLDASSIAIVGDLHGAWADFDAAYFAASEYDLVLFVGDLASGTPARDRAMAKSIARLGKPALVLPGNNDVDALSSIEAELALQQGLLKLLDEDHTAFTQTCGYSLHELRAGERRVSLVTARPFAMGGGELSFPELLRKRHGVASMQASTERLCQLVDEAQSDQLLFLAHNGPRGLGASRYDPWGNDFSEPGGDWGDPDIRDAVQHAQRTRKQVHAVVAGHMHRRVRGGGERLLKTRKDGVLYINPAQVPRVVPSGEGALHHHVALTWRDGGLQVRERWIANGDA